MDTSMTRSKANDAHDVAEAAAKQVSCFSASLLE